VTPTDIIVECRRLLNDTLTPYRYSDAMLLGYVNQILKRTAVLRPDLFGETGDIAVAANTTLQSLPADAHRLIDIFQVKDGDTVTEVDRETMSRNYPAWMSDAAGTPVNFMRHVRNPTKFFLYPKPVVGTVLVGEYAKVPVDYTISQSITQPPSSFFGALVDGVVFLASSVDDEHVNSGRAKMFLDSFTQQLGVSLQNRALNDSKIAGLTAAAPLGQLGEVY
jgi:hypothetical protein